MEEDVGGCEGEVGQHADGDVPLAVARLRRRPEQRVDRVLPEGREQSVADLEGNRGGHRSFIVNYRVRLSNGRKVLLFFP